MIDKRIFITGIALATSCLILAITAWIYIGKESHRRQQEQTNALTQANTQVASSLSSTLDQLLTEASSQLIGMHEEGLSYQLRKWQKNNSLIQETFIWNQTNGFDETLDTLTAQNLPWESNAALSMQALHNYGESGVIDWNNGYFSENLENARYARLAPTPFVAWSHNSTGSELNWICWHQLYEQGNISGFRLNIIDLREDFKTLIDTLSPEGIQTFFSESTESPSSRSESITLSLNDFPGWSLTSSSTVEASLSDSLPLFAQFLIALSLVLALVSGLLIVRTSNRKYNEAMRKTNFVSLVSHELKTPLTSISMYAELIDAPKIDDSKRHKFAATIGRQSDRLRSMIENLLTMSSLEREKQRYTITEVNLTSLAQAIATEMLPTLASIDMTLAVNSQNSEIKVQADEDAVRRVFINLIDNATKYARNGKRIELFINSNSKQTTAFVRDHGPGIPIGKSQKIFETFTQLTDDLNDKAAGIGLGLSISQNIMRDLGGDLSLDRSYTSGASFQITFKS